MLLAHRLLGSRKAQKTGGLVATVTGRRKRNVWLKKEDNVGDEKPEERGNVPDGTEGAVVEECHMS